MKVYLEGMCWVLKYYYQGTPDWRWFFSFRYAPLASDMKNLASLKIEFTLGEPFKPLEQVSLKLELTSFLLLFLRFLSTPTIQLLGVLPPASSALLPKPFQHLMLSPSSPMKCVFSNCHKNICLT